MAFPQKLSRSRFSAAAVVAAVMRKAHPSVRAVQYSHRSAQWISVEWP